jgi:glutamate/aspartate transport system substrate-binding protein
MPTPQKNNQRQFLLENSRMKALVAFLSTLMTVTACAAPTGSEAYTDSSTLKRILVSGTVAIGVRDDARPLSFFADGDPQGYVVDLCQRIINDIGSQFGKTLKLKAVRVTPQNRLDLVNSGRVDMDCGSTTVTEERLRQVAFSLNTYITNTRLLTRADSQLDGGPRQFDALGSATVAVTENTPHEQLIASAMNGTRYQLMRVHDVDDGVRAVIEGKAKAFVQDDILLQTARAAAGPAAKGLTISSSYLSVEPYSIAIVRGDPKFLALVNRSLRGQYADGYAQARLKFWFRDRGYTVSKLTEEAIHAPTTSVAMHN